MHSQQSGTGSVQPGNEDERLRYYRAPPALPGFKGKTGFDGMPCFDLLLQYGYVIKCIVGEPIRPEDSPLFPLAEKWLKLYSQLTQLNSVMRQSACAWENIVKYRLALNNPSDDEQYFLDVFQSPPLPSESPTSSVELKQELEDAIKLYEGENLKDAITLRTTLGLFSHSWDRAMAEILAKEQVIREIYQASRQGNGWRDRMRLRSGKTWATKSCPRDALTKDQWASLASCIKSEEDSDYDLFPASKCSMLDHIAVENQFRFVKELAEMNSKPELSAQQTSGILSTKHLNVPKAPRARKLKQNIPRPHQWIAA